MTKSEKIFNVVVTVAVVLTGAAFGAWAGIGYSERYWWVGLMVGGITGYILAKLYLWQLIKALSKFHSRTITWFWGTFTAVISGLICTTLVHGIMTFIIYPDNPFESSELPGIWPIVVIVAEIIGAVMGFILGAICSLVYILGIKGECRETA